MAAAAVMAAAQLFSLVVLLLLVLLFVDAAEASNTSECSSNVDGVEVAAVLRYQQQHLLQAGCIPQVACDGFALQAMGWMIRWWWVTHMATQLQQQQ